MQESLFITGLIAAVGISAAAVSASSPTVAPAGASLPFPTSVDLSKMTAFQNPAVVIPRPPISLPIDIPIGPVFPPAVVPTEIPKAPTSFTPKQAPPVSVPTVVPPISVAPQPLPSVPAPTVDPTPPGPCDVGLVLDPVLGVCVRI